MTSNKIERFCGIESYSTSENRIFGEIKALPEDFIVEEIDLNGQVCRIDGEDTSIKDDKSTKFIEFKVVKKNIDTLEAVRRISFKIDKIPTYINFAGMKDKRAVTCQKMTHVKKYKELLKSIKLNNIKIFNVKNIEKPIKLGDLYGNSFTITIRNISESLEDIKKLVETKIETINSRNGILNYFGLQRFGEVRPITHTCGKFLLKNDVEGCIRTYLCKGFKDEDKFHQVFRLSLLNDWDLKRARREIPRNLYYEMQILNALIKTGDYNKAFMSLPMKLRTLFLHAYQSFLFNKYLSKKSDYFLENQGLNDKDQVMILNEKGLPTKIVQTVSASNKNHLLKLKTEGRACLAAPIIGYETRNIEDVLKDILEEEEIKQEDFKPSKFMNVNPRGIYRPVFFKPEDFQLIKIEKDGLNENKNQLKISFTLKKGTYATVFLREFIKNNKK